MMRRLIVATRERRLGRTLVSALDWRVGRPLRRALARRWGHPTLTDILLEGGGHLFLTAEDFLASLGVSSVDRYRREFDALCAVLTSRRGHEVYEANFDVGDATAWVLYAHVRASRPRHILETGVANGVSSFFILNALRRNGIGVLHSIDVRQDVGALVNEEERAEWDLRVLRPNFALDLFIHDSDHSYLWMRREFAVAAERISAGGWMMSDDVDASYAFAEFCAAASRFPVYLLDARKYFGAVKM